jgi:hypothetical protein
MLSGIKKGGRRATVLSDGCILPMKPTTGPQKGGMGLGVGVGWGVAVGIRVIVAVGVSVIVAVGVGVRVAVGRGVCVGACVGLDRGGGQGGNPGIPHLGGAVGVHPVAGSHPWASAGEVSGRRIRIPVNSSKRDPKAGIQRAAILGVWPVIILLQRESSCV